MSKNVQDVRQELLWVQEQLARRLSRIREDARHAQPLSRDSADRAQEQENDEVLERLDRSTESLLAQYRHAVQWIDQGRYGTCETCGFPIEPERLGVVPQATQCADCARDFPQ